MYKCFVTCQSQKKYTWNWSKILCIFHFFLYLFYENINQEHNLLPDCAFGPLMYVAKIVCQASLPLFLTWVSLAIFCLEKCQMEIVSSALLSLVGEITHWCMNFDCLDNGSCWDTYKCNILCPTSSIEISLWKRPISNVIPGKLFSSWTVFSTCRVFSRFQNRWLELLLSVYEAFVQKEASTYVEIGYLLHFYVLYQYICIGLFQKKNKQGSEDMEIPGLLKK